MGTITGHGIETLIVGKFEIIVTASSTPAIQKYGNYIIPSKLQKCL
jgi:hypothetical protein